LPTTATLEGKGFLLPLEKINLQDNHRHKCQCSGAEPLDQTPDNSPITIMNQTDKRTLHFNADAKHGNSPFIAVSILARLLSDERHLHMPKDDNTE
jgi:dipeptidyl aminopeptidase/acylaminoacyl peptidase